MDRIYRMDSVSQPVSRLSGPRIILFILSIDVHFLRRTTALTFEGPQAPSNVRRPCSAHSLSCDKKT